MIHGHKVHYMLSTLASEVNGNSFSHLFNFFDPHITGGHSESFIDLLGKYWHNGHFHITYR